MFDCRKKERLFIVRKGGDVAIIFKDLNDKVLWESWFEMKKPYKENFEKITKLFSSLEDLLMRQENKNHGDKI
jgi:hypothetical protein